MAPCLAGPGQVGAAAGPATHCSNFKLFGIFVLDKLLILDFGRAPKPPNSLLAELQQILGGLSLLFLFLLDYSSLQADTTLKL